MLNGAVVPVPIWKEERNGSATFPAASANPETEISYGPPGVNAALGVNTAKVE